ncbi:MAG: Rieske 2Fe-2S domain-containing protein, partial [Deltaproteobacteria bacterium]|nr:Rieske 2Fe-2S domain-containing protein [Deltaproteobacteria bacterium]
YALSARCTHLGCSLNYDPVSQKFRCPCHGSVFDVSGKWLSGPAKKDLYSVPMTKKTSGDIVVTITL